VGLAGTAQGCGSALFASTEFASQLQKTLWVFLFLTTERRAFHFEGVVAMKLGRILIAGYFLIGLLYAVYAHFWGPEPFRSFAFHLGQGVLWPVALFPSLGPVIAGIVVLIFVAVLMSS
jgi:hypothetical protein